MGIFDKFARRKANEPLTPQEAVATILFLTIAADGEISAEEKESFVAISNRMRLLRDQSVEQFNEMIDKISGMLDADGFDKTLVRAAAVVPAALRDTTFALAADLAFADGTVDDNEKGILDAAQTALQVDDEVAIKILEVVQIKNRG